ncbi:MAG: EAL domain-containing protein, partial [Pseudomonadota bacterium]
LALSSAADDPRTVQASFAAGATDCLARPVNYLLLERRLQQLLRAREESRALARSRRCLKLAQRAAHLGDWRLDCASQALECSDEVLRILGLSSATPVDTLESLLSCVHPQDASLAADAFTKALECGTPFHFECSVIAADGRVRTVQLGGQRERGTFAERSVLIGTLLDITDQRGQQAQLRFLANYDQLTRLPNESQLERWLERHAVPDAEPFVLIRFGIDDFQRVGESLSRDERGELLRLLGARLQAAIRQGRPVGALGEARGGRRRQDLAARVGRAEFAVVMADLGDLSHAEHAAERLRRELEAPFDLGARRVYLTVSAGLAAYPLQADQTEALQRAAEVSLGAALRSGGSRTLVYDLALEEHIQARCVREAALRSALAEERFVVFYQPRVDLGEGRVTGAEALLRMRAPDGTLTPPGEFIPLAEELGLIIDLGRFVISESIRQLRTWQKMGAVDRHFVMSINVSPRQFQDPRLFQHIETTLKHEHVSPACVELEITENTLMADLNLASRLLSARREIGIRVAIDDYGTGYSSLNYLRELPADTLKIDRCFVAELAANQTDEVIVRFTVQLAKALGLRVCAEGVETTEQLRLLRALGCDEVQGFLYGRPMHANEFTARLSRARAIGDDEAPPARQVPGDREEEGVIVLESALASSGQRVAEGPAFN